MHWQLIIVEFNPKLVYIKGKRNIVANALSRLEMSQEAIPELKGEITLSEYYANDQEDLPANGFPVQYKEIQHAQQQDVTLLEKLHSSNKYSMKTF